METATQPSFAEWHPGEREDGQVSRRGADRSQAVKCEFAEERLASLTQTIEAQIIPRLMLVHKAVAQQPFADAVDGPNQAEVIELTRMVMIENATTVSAYVATIRARGVSLESIYLDLLAPAARRLGDLWSADQCDFTTVTIGTCHLQQVIRELTRNCPIEINYCCKDKRAVFAAARGDQHTLGLVMIAELFSNAGWDVCASSSSRSGALVALVKNEWFDLIGLSAGSEAQLDSLAEDVFSSRRASANQAVIIMVGGPLFVTHPELVERVGADATAVDGRQAIEKAESLMLRIRAGK